MTKIELAKELAVSEGLHLSTAVKAIDGIIRIMKDSLINGHNITLRGFGTLACIRREAHSGYHFHTGESIDIPAVNTVKFKISNELKELLNNEQIP
ncbi:MAG: HU family DNA-binding protein [Muribaculaceae bacterium]|nr:HU family DNA-binding protein [Muribaculaceae bacterium]